MNNDVGLLLLRFVIGLLIAGHGVQKVTHRLGGKGLEGGIRCEDAQPIGSCLRYWVRPWGSRTQSR